MKNICIFASGTGTNTNNLVERFNKEGSDVKVALIVTNNPNAGVIEIAKQHGVPFLIISNSELNDANFSERLKSYNLNLIVLAGFLRKIPEFLINSFKGKIINIHPSLLPKFGGDKMYGNKVFEAVKAAGEEKTGPTVHFVDSGYDTGEIILQEGATINPTLSIDEIRKVTQEIEHRIFPKAIEHVLKKQK